MLTTCAVLLVAAAIAFAAAPARVIAVVLGLGATAILVLALGAAAGLAVAVAATMTAGSVLALVLRPSARAASPSAAPARAPRPVRSSAPGHTALRSAAVVLGAPLAAIALGVALLRLPLAPELAFAIAAHAVLPAWVTLACVLPLARSGLRAWAWCSSAVLIAGLSTGLGAP